MTRFYAGIGSQEADKKILSVMRDIACELARRGFILRSGGADGADTAFEIGAGSKKEIFLPWKGFNENDSCLYNPTLAAAKLAESVIPWWNNLSQGSQKLHARNAHQVLGWTLREPVEFVLCWTKNGASVGGTRTAIVIAKNNKIPVINMYSSCDTLNAAQWVELIEKTISRGVASPHSTGSSAES